VVGFGLGHFIIHDQANFTLFLIVDIALIAAQIVLNFIPYIYWIGYIAGVALLASHIWQGLDAYGKASGQKIVQWNRENAVQVALSEERGVPVTTRVFALQF
jgi:hypothetical protein